MKSISITITLFFIFLQGCAPASYLSIKENLKDSLSLTQPIRIIHGKPSIWKKQLFCSKLDTINNSICITHSDNKIKRKLGEYNISVLSDTSIPTDTINQQIIDFLSSLDHSKDIRTILPGDSLSLWLNQYSENVFLIYYQFGAIFSAPRIFLWNLPFYILDIVSLDLSGRWRWNDGYSRAWIAIFNKETHKAIFYGYHMETELPQDEITTNKHFEILIDKFVNKIKLK
jgi:hypothetical protein